MKGFFNRLKRGFNRYLKRMAAENKKNFGNQRLDCCSINKSKPGTKTQDEHDDPHDPLAKKEETL